MDIVSELKDKGIRSAIDANKYLSKKYKDYYYLPEIIIDLILEVSMLNTPKNCIVLNSNLGEIQSRIIEVESCIGIEENNQNYKAAKYLYPNLVLKNINPLEYKSPVKFDSVICYPILGQKIDVNGKKKHSESLYVLKSLELLNENGSAVFLLPLTFLTLQSFEGLRKEIFDKYGIKRIVSLPSKSVNINISTDFAIVEITKVETQSTAFYKITNKEKADFSIANRLPDFEVLKDKLDNRWDYQFHDPKHFKDLEILDNLKTEIIEDIVDVIKGVRFKSEEKLDKGDYKILSPVNIKNGFFESTNKDKYINKLVLNNQESRAVLKTGDIVFSQLNIDSKKICFYVYSSNEGKLIANHNLVILRGEKADYVTTYLSTTLGVKLFKKQIRRYSRGVIAPLITISDLKKIRIPILPIDDFELASKGKLEKLSTDELLKVKTKYESIEDEYNRLRNNYRLIENSGLDYVANEPSTVYTVGFEDKIYSHEILLKSMYSMLMEVLDNQKKLDNKLNDVTSLLLDLTNDFKEIKKLPRELDEKIVRLNENLDNKLDSLLKDKKKLDFYIIEIRRWFDYYDLLELKSQKYLPEAEYIFDHISKLENPDYSPFILQYCRALENELLKKIFRSYVQSLIDRNINLEIDFAWDFGRKESGKPNSDNTLKLAKHLQRCIKRGEEQWFFELGSMEVNLRYLTGKTAEKSPLLLDLKSFVLERFDLVLLNIEYLDEIKIIIRDYRNQSAHPNLIDTDKAVLFHKKVKACLISLMENYKQ